MVELYFIAEKFWLKTILFKEFNLFAKQLFDKHYFFLPSNGFFCKEWQANKLEIITSVTQPWSYYHKLILFECLIQTQKSNTNEYKKS